MKRTGKLLSYSSEIGEKKCFLPFGQPLRERGLISSPSSPYRMGSDVETRINISFLHRFFLGFFGT